MLNAVFLLENMMKLFFNYLKNSNLFKIVFYLVFCNEQSNIYQKELLIKPSRLLPPI